MTKYIQGSKMSFVRLLKELFYLMCGSLALTFVFLSLSPLHPWKMGEIGTDSAIYKTVSMMMSHSYMPYKDSIDCRGPLLYVINWLGDRLAFYRGVWVLEFLFLLIVTMILYKTARLSCSRVGASIAVLGAYSIFFSYFNGGNHPEEYALLFVSASQFIILGHMAKSRISGIRSVLLGVCLGALLLLTPVILSLWVCLAFFSVPSELKNKGMKSVVRQTILFIAGVLIVLTPVLTWMFARGALSSFVDTYFGLNWKHITAYGTFASCIDSFLSFLSNPILIAAIMILLCNIRSDPPVNTMYLAYALSILILVSVFGRGDDQHGLLMAPVVVYPVSLFFRKVESLRDAESRRVLLMLISVVFILFLIPPWLDTVKNLPQVYDHRNEASLPEPARTIAGIIDDNTESEDHISVYGNWDIVYVMSRRAHATRYSYQFPYDKVDPGLLDDYFIQLKADCPKYIVIQEDHMDDNMKAFLRENEYKLFWSLKPDEENSPAIYERALR